jgi:hypothetical protein
MPSPLPPTHQHRACLAHDTQARCIIARAGSMQPRPAAGTAVSRPRYVAR